MKKVCYTNTGLKFGGNMKKKFLTFILSICFIIPCVFMLSACTTTPADIEFKVENGYIQYYDGDSWSNLISIEDLEGEDGIGVDGREVEFQKTSTHIQWRYKTNNNSDTWKNLIALTELNGEDGREVEFRKTSTHIQWRYVDANQGVDANWTNLVALSEIQGDEGTDGKEVEFRKTSTHIQWRYVVAGQEADAGWINLITIEELKGNDATYSTYTITYDYGKASDLFESAKSSDTIKSTEWLTTLPKIKDENKDSFLGWFIQGTNKEVSNYDFVGGNVTLEARFDIEKLGLSGFYQQGKYTMTWNDLLETYPDAFSLENSQIKGDGIFNSYFKALSGEMIIDKSITSIGYNAFSQCDNITNVIIPNTVTTIEGYAFANCDLLTEIKLPDSILTIGTNAFNGCKKLETIKISSNLQSIGNSAFTSCESLTEIEIPNSVTTMGWYVFSGCNKISSITIPENLQQIDSGTFAGMKGLETINYNAIKLNDLTREDLNSSDIFGDMGYNVDIVTINIGPKVERIPSYLFDMFYTFSGDSNYDTKFVLNFTNAIKCQSIGQSAFSHWETVQSIILSNHLTIIEECAFGYWYELTDIYFYGTKEEWESITIGSHEGSEFASATKYFYSVVEPTDEGNYWHFDIDGKTPVAW